MSTSKVYLVRHGEYDWDDQPGPHKGMTPRGMEQARLTAERLSSVPAPVIYSSDLMRAIETAEMIRSGRDAIPYEKDVALRECLLPGTTLEAPAELVEAGKRQADSVFAKYLRPSDQDSNVIIVSHGNVIRYLAACVLGDPSCWLRMRTSNCGITELVIESDGRMWVVSYNDVGHLPVNLVTAGMPALP